MPSPLAQAVHKVRMLVALTTEITVTHHLLEALPPLVADLDMQAVLILALLKQEVSHK
jgi:hypothetical protein